MDRATVSRVRPCAQYEVSASQRCTSSMSMRAGSSEIKYSPWLSSTRSRHHDQALPRSLATTQRQDHFGCLCEGHLEHRGRNDPEATSASKRLSVSPGRLPYEPLRVYSVVLTRAPAGASRPARPHTDGDGPTARAERFHRSIHGRRPTHELDGDVNATVGEELDGAPQRTPGSMRITLVGPQGWARAQCERIDIGVKSPALAERHLLQAVSTELHRRR